ncbi:MAG: MBL fold metallo-hydrolase [Spirochaetales bacterium]|nr:MBL fold metallo-hydrolase [Spirochaetales bacterium]
METLESLEFDTFRLSGGELKIYFIGHGTLMFDYAGYILHVDPVTAYADYRDLPPGDVILITHQHFDHLEKEALDKATGPSTVIILDNESAGILGKGTILRHGESLTLDKDVRVKAVPAYNTTEDRQAFHPKGRDNGYLITFGGFTVYVAGDTEPIPEMGNLGKVDVAFLPMNQPYTMTPLQVAEATEKIQPTILYPYHFGTTDTTALLRLMESKPTEVRIRSLA